MLNWNLKEDLVTVLVGLILILFIAWFTISQPTFTVQESKTQVKYVKAENLKKHVYTLVEKFDDRVYSNIEMLNATAEYIHDILSQYSNDVRYQTFELNDLVDSKSFSYTNVVARFKGKGHCENEIVVIGAHYDTFGGHTGANDNTSSVAGILELARLLKETTPRCTVEIVAYTLEEPPAFGTEKMGSFIHAQRLQKHGVKVKLAVVLDMIGFYSDKENSQNYPVPFMDLYYPTTANFISVVSNFSNILAVREVKNALKSTSELPVYSINAPAFIPGIDFSDHRNYWKFNYPAVMISDTAFYRSDNYHTKKDKPETLNYEKMAQVMEGVFNLVTR